MSKQGIVNIKGKDYKTVALRVAEFREKFPSYYLTTEIVKIDDDQCIVKAYIGSHVPNGNSQVYATGHAHEFRKASQINGTSYVENCETSAIGRALACLGIGGTEFASANEVLNAIHQQNNPPATQDDIEDVIKQINKADSVDELMGIYKEASTKFDKVSLAKLKTYLTDRKNELEA
jgi:hypothetical protein